jgi:hypothetical protein
VAAPLLGSHAIELRQRAGAGAKAHRPRVQRLPTDKSGLDPVAVKSEAAASAGVDVLIAPPSDGVFLRRKAQRERAATEVGPTSHVRRLATVAVNPEDNLRNKT